MPVRNFFFIVVAFLVCYACYSVAVKNRYANLFAEAIDIVENEALHGVPSDQLFTSAMEGMLEGFDRHSRFITGDTFKSLNEDLEGEFGGVGIYFEPVKAKGVLVMAAMPGKPADLAGLQAGDIITAINETSTADLDSREIRKLMTGKLGENLKVTFERDGTSNDTVLRREVIAIQSVRGFTRLEDGSWDFMVSGYPNLAYIRLAQFDKMSASEMLSVLEDLPDNTTGIILDLRSNGGGLLTAAESICDMFLDPGLTIVRIKGRKGLSVRESKSSAEPLISARVKLAVLIDRQSASASELVAGCLQDHDRAVIVGEQSWGKGTVQNVIPMKMGTSALKLTTFSFWRPTGPVIDRYNKDAIRTGKWGIYPNDGMAVEQDALDMVCILKRMHFQEIGGLIPESKREEILSVSRDNFLQKINEREEPEQDAAIPEDQDSDFVEAAESDQDELPDREVAPEDLERDRVIEKAIEFLSKFKIEKQAA